jgi:cold shock CspA family protein
MVMQFRTIPLAQRQDIFFKLVTLQDAKSKGIRESKKIIIDQFQIDDATLEKITEEGMDRNWPPLSDSEEDVQVSDSDVDADSVKSIDSDEEAIEAIESNEETTESTEATDDEVTHLPEA